jgi:uncharacterized protein (DUF1800 family)
MTTIDSFIATHRFGLGPRPGEMATVASDPRGWVLAQIGPEAALPTPLAGRPTTRARLRQITGSGDGDGDRARTIGELARNISLPEIRDQYTVRVTTDTPFRERMVSFWTNHFSVSANKGYNAAIASAFPQEAIRPHVFGRFEDLLFAAETHPAMLVYLDNILSIGPNSPFGRRSDRDINENLAREILELHTLGVDGGYAQADVEALAAILTGWTVEDRRFARRIAAFERRNPGRVTEEIGQANFVHPAHEPGPKTLLGRRYAEGGPDEFRAATQALARHPSTARFLATKLVRHFVADDPPPAEVGRIAGVYRDTEGDLAAVSAALVGLEAAWQDPLAKAKTPDDFVVAAMRAVGARTADIRVIGGVLLQMGQRPFMAPSPQGWPDTAEAWIAPGSLMARIEFARALAARAGENLPPERLAAGTIGPVITVGTQSLIAGAPSGEEANAFILSSREFQRR